MKKLGNFAFFLYSSLCFLTQAKVVSSEEVFYNIFPCSPLLLNDTMEVNISHSFVYFFTNPKLNSDKQPFIFCSLKQKTVD